MTITKAIIPAAGLGTRVAHISKGLPKEMMLVAGKPMIAYSVEEAIRAQIFEICIVISKRKQIISEYLQENFGSKASLTFLYQEQPKGLADAIYRTKDFVDKKPFAILLPDNIFISDTPAIKQLSQIYQVRNTADAREQKKISNGVYPLRNTPYARKQNKIFNGVYRPIKKDLIGCIKVTSDVAALFGNSGRIDYQELLKEKTALFRITRLYDKKPGQFSTGEKPSTIRTFARYITAPHIFDYIEKVMEEEKVKFGSKANNTKYGESMVHGELDDVPVLQKMVKNARMLGVLLEGEAFDVGNPAGYQAANSKIGTSP